MTSLQHKVVQNCIENLIIYLQPLIPLANSHMVDYFSKDSLNTFISQELKIEILELGYENAIKILFNKYPDCDAPKLQEYINLCKKWWLCNIPDVCIRKDEINYKLMEWGCKNTSSLKLDIFMTAKKSHEVEILSKVAAAMNFIKQTSHIIDIGDGKGYLSSMLALYHKLPVLGIDASTVNTNGAVKRAHKLSKFWNCATNKLKVSNLERDCDEKLYKQITSYITEDSDLTQLITNVFLEHSLRIGLVGLHTCGNLSPTSLRLFNNDNNIKTICNVSCCYHLLTERLELDSFSNDDKIVGFPMSKFLQNSNFVLGRNARMLASISIDRIANTKELPSKTLFYRSILELLFEKYNISLEKRRVGRMRKDFSNFSDYAKIALRNVNIQVTDEELNKLYKDYAIYRDQLNVFYLLRCILAPVIESLILLDKLLYLLENNCENAFLIQLFDPVISPRCYGLVAFKND